MLPGFTPWPAEEVARYRRLGYWRGERLGELLRGPDPERDAIVTASERWTYGTLDGWAERLAGGLSDLGLRAGDRVVVALGNGPEIVVLSVALFRLGAQPVFALPAHRRAELEHLARMTDAVALVAPEAHQGFDFEPVVEAVMLAVPTLRHGLIAGSPKRLRALSEVLGEPRWLPGPDSQDVAFFLLSGGTTGMPKLIPRTHDDYACQLRLSAEAIGAGADTVYLAALPVAHNAALGCPGALGTLALGGRVVMAGSPSPDEALPLIARERVTLTTVMPTFLLLWSELIDLFRVDLTGVTVEVGGARLDPALAEQAQARLGCVLSHWFGMAEGVLCCTRPSDPVRLAARTQGRPLCAIDELLVVDEADRPVPAGEVGQLLVRGPMTLRGYYNDPEHNRGAFTADGFLRTGDLVRLTGAGELVVTGRIKDVVNRGGEKIPTGEVEEHLRTHPLIRDAAVVPMPDRVLGERVCAFVVPCGEAPTLASVRKHLIACGLAEFKLPDRLEVIEQLERTPLGKVDKKRLRADLAPA